MKYIIYNIIYNIGELSLERNIKARQNITLIGVLEMRKGHVEQARAFFQVDLVILLKFHYTYTIIYAFDAIVNTENISQSAASLSPHQFECHYNYAVLSEKTGDLQVSCILCLTMIPTKYQSEFNI